MKHAHAKKHKTNYEEAYEEKQKRPQVKSKSLSAKAKKHNLTKIENPDYKKESLKSSARQPSKSHAQDREYQNTQARERDMPRARNMEENRKPRKLELNSVENSSFSSRPSHDSDISRDFRHMETNERLREHRNREESPRPGEKMSSRHDKQNQNQKLQVRSELPDEKMRKSSEVSQKSSLSNVHNLERKPTVSKQLMNSKSPIKSLSSKLHSEEDRSRKASKQELSYEVKEDKQSHKWLVSQSSNGSLILDSENWVVECKSKNEAKELVRQLEVGKIQSPTEAPFSYLGPKRSNSGNRTIYTKI